MAQLGTIHRYIHLRHLILIASFLLIHIFVFSSGGLAQDYEYIENQIIIKFKAGAQPEETLSLRDQLRGVVVERFALIGAQLWNITGISVPQAIARFQNDPRIDYIEPNYILSVIDTIPNDESFPSLWAMHNTGQTGGTTDADIDAPEAWDTHRDCRNIVVGVIDSGVNYNHPDLAANIWTNPNEIAGNGIDDDNNGFVDDVHGWDFVNGDSDPMDDYDHGSHVSGTIAAVGNNGIGVTGVCWRGRIMAVKSFDSSGRGQLSDSIRAIEYVTMMKRDFGIDVRLTNNSWGGGGFSQAMYDAIRQAQDVGMLFVAAAGNESVDNDEQPFYPASYDLESIIAVAATDHVDARSSFSNYGTTTVDLGAPGSSILSTMADGRYASASGTSMATPHVAGTAALVWSLEPQRQSLNIKSVIMASVDPIDSMTGITVSEGRLNTHRALEWITDEVSPDAVTDLEVLQEDYDAITLTWTASGDDGSQGKAWRYDIRYATYAINNSNFNQATQVPDAPIPSEPGSQETFTVLGLDDRTTYFFAIKVSDDAGNTSRISNSPSGTTVGPPEIDVSPAAVNATVPVNGSTSKMLTVRNTGEGSLRFHLRGGLTRGASITGFGGSDDYGYVWVDSDDPEGPRYEWAEILDIGTDLNLPDDGFQEIELPFAFPFYGANKTSVKISSNGYLTFGTNGSAYENQPIPQETNPNDMIAPFWDDFDPFYGVQGRIIYYHDRANSRFIVQYNDVRHGFFLFPEKFQVILYRDGTIVFQYHTVSVVNSCSVGIENHDGTDGLQVVYNSNYLKNEMAIKIFPAMNWLTFQPRSGTLASGRAARITVNINAAKMISSITEALILVINNDPDQPVVEVPLTVTFGPATAEFPWILFYPAFVGNNNR
jgi:subtilisin family serine protease